MRKYLFVGVLLCLFGTVMAQKNKSNPKWRLGVQSANFHRFPLGEALTMVEKLGIRYIEIYPGHPLGDGFDDKHFSSSISVATQNKIKAIAAEHHIQIVAMGVLVEDNPENWERHFAFAKLMRMEFITAEPALADWDLVESLAKKYGIKVAVHNHPKPSTYWTPDGLAAVIQNRSEIIGSCADVGHWKREGIDPLKAMKTLNGRILSLHFKDVAPKGGDKPELQDTVWGKGILNVKRMMKELKRQNFNGVFSIEHEKNWDNPMPDLAENIKYFKAVVKELF